MRLILSPEAARAMQPKKMPTREPAALVGNLAEFAADPFGSHTWALSLTGLPDRVRIRQGDWRAVVLIMRAEDTVIVERVEHRRDVYR